MFFKNILYTLTISILTFSQCLYNTMKNNLSHPPSPATNNFCVPEKGACEIPQTDSQSNDDDLANIPKAIKPVQVLYVTDPICSACWGIEGQLRRLKGEYGDYVDVNYCMGGLLPSWQGYNGGGISKPADVASHWEEASRYYEMPIDGDIWLKDPLPSSYPPSIAFKAAQLQDPHKALLFLRRIKEMLFLENKNITKNEYLAAAATEVGLSPDALIADMQGEGKIRFEADLALSRQLGVRGFPTLIFSDDQGKNLTLYGYRTYDQFEQLLLKLAPNAIAKKIPQAPNDFLEEYPSFTTKEFSILNNCDIPTAEKTLKEWQNQGFIEQYKTPKVAIWRQTKK